MNNGSKNNNKIWKPKGLQHWQIVTFLLVLYDIFAVNLSYFLGLWIRFDCHVSLIDIEFLNNFIYFAPIYTVVSIIIFRLLRLYNSIWRFASFSEMVRTMLASLFTGVFHTIGISLIFGRMPVSYYMFGFVVQFLMILGIRFSYRFVLLQRKRSYGTKVRNTAKKNIMIIGAGSAGQMLISDIIQNSDESGMTVRCIIDDNPNKWNRFINGIPVVAGRDKIAESAEKYSIDKIFLAMPSAPATVIRDILGICSQTKCELKTLPGVYQLVTGEITVEAMRDVAVEDLLGRDPIRVDLSEIMGYISDKVILVTGGGGSIGSELCRQIATHNPKQLIIFDIYENNAYEIEQELKRKHPELNLVVFVGSVRDSKRLHSVFSTYHPDIVYHAAAHKHVPLMETSPCEAIKNNVIGTYKTAYAALHNGCKRFVLISTDKAVNPTNIMGASKRLCEMVVQTMDSLVRSGRYDLLPYIHTHTNEVPEIQTGNITNTEFVAVRFGNVLGSNGSVIPLFKKQIAEGGPVTITHPDIIRYFMTIPEAVSLVLQAGAYAHGGEIFVLDMGDPIKIDTMARNLIKLSGFIPDVDIKIEYTGLRPGEKLYEEKLMAEEGMKTTPNKLIHIGQPIELDVEKYLVDLKKLADAAHDNDEKVVEMVRQMVPTFVDPNKQEK